MNGSGILIMAAGKGTRMKSAYPKVLHNILDRPLIDYIVKNALSCVDTPERVAVLVGFGGELVEEHIKNNFPGVKILWQREQKGTGHAVMTAQSWWRDFENLIVLNGDLPLMRNISLSNFIAASKNYDCFITSFITQNPKAYGRVIREGAGIRIVEFKDASPEQKNINEVNAGCYAFKVASLQNVLGGLSNRNSQEEYYLTDVLALMNAKKMTVNAFIMPEIEMQGVNNLHELYEANNEMRMRIINKHLENGVHIMDLSSVFIGADVEIGGDVAIMPNVHIWGNSKIGANSLIGTGSVLNNAIIGEHVNIVAYAIIENSELKANSKAGPFVYIREGSCLNENAFAGKFVELKNSNIGQNSKVPHLSYMGDAILGHDVNIGAGSITCNYDGSHKNKTVIGDNCFIGSDTMFVAPVEVENNSATAAGSVITKTIPENALGVARSRQVNIAGWTKLKNAKTNNKGE